MHDQQRTDAIRKIVVGMVITEYGLIQLVDITKQSLKERTRKAIKACNTVQQWFTSNPDATEQQKRDFRREFKKDEILLISELLTTIWGLPEADLELIIKAIQQNTN